MLWEEARVEPEMSAKAVRQARVIPRIVLRLPTYIPLQTRGHTAFFRFLCRTRLSHVRKSVNGNEGCLCDTVKIMMPLTKGMYITYIAY